MMLTQERIYQAFYTKSRPIVDYMIGMLKLQIGDKILEPCAGDGVFIEAILGCSPKAIIHAFEINPEAVVILNRKFSLSPNVSVRQSDTLLDNNLFLFANFGGKYEKIIANPPYGAWQNYNKTRVWQIFS